jgi:lipid A 3-O-deacylase
MDAGEFERKMPAARTRRPEKRMRRALGAAAVALSGLIATTGGAGPVRAQTLSVDDPSYLAIGLGAFDALHDETAGEARLEYRFGTKLLGVLKPVIGGIVTSDGGTYGYGGFMADIYFGSNNNWVLSPSATVGAWQKGNGKDIGSWVEFKTGAEFAYRFADRSRLGISFHHISNAGLTERNPGEESFELVWSIPFPLLK